MIVCISQKKFRKFQNFRTIKTLSRRNILETQFFTYFSKFELLTNKCVFLESRRVFYSKVNVLLTLRTKGNRCSENSEHLILEANEIKKATFLFAHKALYLLKKNINNDPSYKKD